MGKRPRGDIRVAQRVAIDAKRRRREEADAARVHEQKFNVSKVVVQQIGKRYGMLMPSPLIDCVGGMVLAKREVEPASDEMGELTDVARSFLTVSAGRTNMTRTAQADNLGVSRKSLTAPLKTFTSAVWLFDRWWRRVIMQELVRDPRSEVLQIIDDVGYDETPAEVAGGGSELSIVAGPARSTETQ
eukprot:1590826-Pyramimonas_sp.AAC.1